MFSSFFEPRSVAVIGASRTPAKVGYDIVHNLLEGGYEGPIYPVNPKAEEILSLKCYPELLSIEGDVDLAIIVIPARLVLDAIDQCARKGTRAVIVISAGFKESGPEGAELEKKLADRCTAAGIRCIGPNCLGVISAPAKLNASFSAVKPKPGNIAFLSQSGALGTAILDVALGEGLGISRFVSYGNKADVDETDLLEALGQDEQTGVILAYLESIDDGQKFISVVQAVTQKKPVIIMKSGRTTAGARAASSHTGSLAGSDSAYEAAFKQCGVIRAESVTEFFDLAAAFSFQQPPSTGRVAVVTNAGGPGIIATDALEASSLSMAELSAETTRALKEGLPPQANISNPVDVLGDARADRYRLALEAVTTDPNVDAVLVLLTPQSSTEEEETAEVIATASQETGKCMLTCFMGAPSVEKAVKILNEKGVPNFRSPDGAVRALEAMYRYGQWQQRKERGLSRFDFDGESIAQVLSEASGRGMKALGERSSHRILAACGIPVPRSVLAASEDEAVRCAEQIGYPVVLKVSSEDILHKSDAGGVKVGLADEGQVREAFREILSSAKDYKPDARIDGALVQQMVQGGTEVIVGMNRDPQFGPVIMFGLGGIYVELLKDVAFRVAPLTPEDAAEMVGEIRSAQILKGFRGQPPADVAALTECIAKVSQLTLDFPQIAECDLNPLKVFTSGHGIIAVDARFGLQ